MRAAESAKQTLEKIEEEVKEEDELVKKELQGKGGEDELAKGEEKKAEKGIKTEEKIGNNQGSGTGKAKAATGKKKGKGNNK